MKAKTIPGVPRQHKGGFHDTESKKEIRIDAELNFNILKQRFLNINGWREYCNDLSADFKLYNANGDAIERLPQKGDFIRIDLMGCMVSDKDSSFDWVEIIKLDFNARNSCLMECAPSSKPQSKNSVVNHFYDSSSTSTFIITKKGNCLKAGIYGRNEMPNLKTSFLRKIRSLIISLAGMLGFSKIEWKCLADGWLDFEEQKF